MNESRHTYEWGMSHIWMSHITYMHEPRHTHEWVRSQIWTNHVPHVHPSCHTHTHSCDTHTFMSHTHMHHITRDMMRCICVFDVWHMDRCTMIQSHRQFHTSRASFIRVSCDILICVPWLTHKCVILHAKLLQHTATRCNTLQHTARHCSTLQHATTHYNSPTTREISICNQTAFIKHIDEFVFLKVIIRGIHHVNVHLPSFPWYCVCVCMCVHVCVCACVCVCVCVSSFWRLCSETFIVNIFICSRCPHIECVCVCVCVCMCVCASMYIYVCIYIYIYMYI